MYIQKPSSNAFCKKVNTKKKTQLFIHNKYFAVLYRSFVNMLK